MSAKLIKGSKESFSIFLKDEDGNSFPLTDYVTGPGDVEICIPSSPASTVVSIIAGGVTVPTPSNGEIKVELSSTETDAISAGDYDLDIVLKPTADPTNPIITKLSSALSVEDRAC